MDARFMSREELCGIVEKMVEREVKRQLNDMKLGKQGDEKYVSVKELCRMLDVSRQTVNNWRRSSLKIVITPYVQKVGGKVLYDVEGLKRTMRMHEDFFGRGRYYNYKDEIRVTDRDRRDTRYKAVNWQVLNGEAISEEDRIFYEEECKWRGDRNRLTEKAGVKMCKDNL